MSLLSEKIRRIRRPFCSMVVVAAGNSTRMGEDKLFIDLGGMPVLARTLLAFENCDEVDEIIVVTREDLLCKCAELCIEYGIDKAEKFILGGTTRVYSALAGVAETSERARLIGIHDGARPFVADQLICSVIRCAHKFDAAVPALPVTDTVKFISGPTVETTPLRNCLRAVQTPQVFNADIIKCALTAAVENEIELTDDASAVEELGLPVHIVDGDADNIKLTTPRDLVLAEIILGGREGAQCE